VTFRMVLEVALTYGSEESPLRGRKQQSMDSLIKLIHSNVAPDCVKFAGTVFPVRRGRKRSKCVQHVEILVQLLQ